MTEPEHKRRKTRENQLLEHLPNDDLDNVPVTNSVVKMEESEKVIVSSPALISSSISTSTSNSTSNSISTSSASVSTTISASDSDSLQNSTTNSAPNEPESHHIISKDKISKIIQLFNPTNIFGKKVIVENKVQGHTQILNFYFSDSRIKICTGYSKFPINSGEHEDLTGYYSALGASLNPFETTLNSFYNIKALDQGPQILILSNKMILLPNYNQELNDKIIFAIIYFKIDILVIKNPKFNSSIQNIPSRIKNLRIYSSKFNQSLNYLPYDLEHLVIKGERERNSCFNQDLSELPAGLKELVIVSKKFNSPIDNLPDGLTKLIIADERGFFDHPIDNLPDSIELLYIESQYFNQKINRYPSSLKHLILQVQCEDGSFDNLPDGLLSFYHGIFWSEYNFELNNLPTSLKILHVGQGFNSSLDLLPSSIKFLIIGDDDSDFNQPISGLPYSLKYFSVYNQNYNFEFLTKSGVNMEGISKDIPEYLEYPHCVKHFFNYDIMNC